tara:strand:- start:109 stop:753 length:645 start_codon:yes stop_codon:yes gene_type:complete
MKITRRQLRQIIKEELTRLTEAGEKLVTQGKFKGYVGRSGQKGYVVIGDHVYGPTAIDKIIAVLSKKPGMELERGKHGGPPATTDSVKAALEHLKGMTVPDEHPVTGQLAGLSLTGETFAERTTMDVMKALFARKLGGAQPEKKSVNEGETTTSVKQGIVVKNLKMLVDHAKMAKMMGKSGELDKIKKDVAAGKYYKDDSMKTKWTTEELNKLI